MCLILVEHFKAKTYACQGSPGVFDFIRALQGETPTREALVCLILLKHFKETHPLGKLMLKIIKATQPTFTRSKSTTETVEKGVKYI